jgi:hypothetical protein
MTKHLSILDAFISCLNLGLTGAAANAMFLKCFPQDRTTPHEENVTTNGFRIMDGNQTIIDRGWSGGILWTPVSITKTQLIILSACSMLDGAQ